MLFNDNIWSETIFQIVYRTGVVPDHKLILALAFQADPRSVEGMKGAPVLEHTVWT